MALFLEIRINIALMMRKSTVSIDLNKSTSSCVIEQARFGLDRIIHASLLALKDGQLQRCTLFRILLTSDLESGDDDGLY